MSGRRRRERGQALPTSVDEDGAFDDLAAHRLDRRDHRQQRPARGEDVVDEEDPLAGLDPESAPELALGVPSWPRTSSAKRPAPELTRGLEGQDDATGRGARHEVHGRATAVAPLRRVGR